MLRQLSLLTLALIATSEMFAQTPVLPSDAIALRKAYDDARQRALQPIEQKYRIELEKLLAAHTKAGHLDDAIAIRAELSTLSSSTAQPEPVTTPRQGTEKQSDQVISSLRGTKWKSAKADKPIISFYPDKDTLQVFWSEGGSGSYDYTVERRKVLWKMGGRPTQTLEFSNDWRSFEWNGTKMIPANAP
jgi:hypothetical protein